MSERRQVFAIVLTVITAVLLFVSGVNYLFDSSNGSAQCYSDFKAVYTYEHTRPALDKIWADHHITEGECHQMDKLYEEAKQLETESEIQEVIREQNAAK